MAGALVVGYDGSDCAHAALEEAISLARSTGDRIVIGFGYDAGGPGEEYRVLRDEVKRFGERATQPAVARAEEAGVEATVALVPQRPVDALLALGDEHDARAIVVGTHGEGPLKGPSWARYRTSSCRFPSARCWWCRCARTDRAPKR